MAGGDGIQAKIQENLAYFNSNDFHGHQFTTRIDAGYNKSAGETRSSLLEKERFRWLEQEHWQGLLPQRIPYYEFCSCTVPPTAKNMIDDA
jgi:hypothetical protein